MMRYAIQTGDRIFVKGYGLLSFAKNMGKNISKSSDTPKYSCSKYSQKRFNHAKHSATNALKTSSK